MRFSRQKKIVVIGVGKAGRHAVARLDPSQLKDVLFVLVLAHGRAIPKSSRQGVYSVAGLRLTECTAGRGPGKYVKPALRVTSDMRAVLWDETDVAFIVSGAGDTTGAAIAQAVSAKKQGVLTVGILVAPIGLHRKLGEAEDCFIVLPDNRRRKRGRIASGGTGGLICRIMDSIADLLTIEAVLNVDIADLKTVMADAGEAAVDIWGMKGREQDLVGAQKTLAFPALSTNMIQGAKRVLVSIVSGRETDLGVEEYREITDHVQAKAGPDAEIMFGHRVHDDLKDDIRVTLIATGLA